jgi:oleate hydratase
VFCGDVEKTLWESFTVTCRDPRIPDRLAAITRRDPMNGRIVPGGPCTIRDSSWLLTFTVSRQPHFRDQPPGVLVLWAYSLFSDVPGDHVPKTMRECTGAELLSELLFHLGVPVAEIPDEASAATVIPAMTAVYELLHVDRAEPEAYPSMYDLRDAARASKTLQEDDPMRGAGFVRRFLKHTQFDELV